MPNGYSDINVKHFVMTHNCKLVSQEKREKEPKPKKKGEKKKKKSIRRRKVESAESAKRGGPMR